MTEEQEYKQGMTFKGAIIKERGVTFAIASVKKSVVDSRDEAEKALQIFKPYFPGLPIVLMAPDESGRSLFLGRKDIVNFLSRVPSDKIPWKNFTIHETVQKPEEE